MNRIAFAGKSGSGKSSLAEYLRKTHGFAVLKFSDPVYELAHEFFGMQGKNRELLQRIGQKFREINPDVWVNHLIKRAEGIKDRNILVEDCRLNRELNALRSAGYTLVGLICPYEVRIKRLENRDGASQAQALNDCTETELDRIIGQCDYSINTDCEFDEVLKQLEHVLLEKQ